MPINPNLLARLEQKLGVGRKYIYKLIQDIANDEMLDRNAAALRLASKNGISLNRYATPTEIADMRHGVRAAKPADNVAAAAVPSPRRLKATVKKAVIKTKKNSVFVVHGRNDALRKSMFDFLRSISLQPLEWEKAILKAKGANPHVDDIIDSAMNNVGAVLVLLSPDDEVKLKDEFCHKDERTTEGKTQGQARPNVIFEAGLALGRHREKTLLVQVGKIKNISDIAGKHITRLSNDPVKRIDLANRLKKIGCDIDLSGTDWTSTGDFSA